MARIAARFGVAWMGVLILLSGFVHGESPPAARGDLFGRRCSGCHAVDEDKEGPRLRGVYGRQSGTVATFRYSDALKNARVAWDAGSLDQWLTDPEKLVPDTDMAFRVAKPEERAEIIEYLKQISGPRGLSPPKPAQQPCR